MIDYDRGPAPSRRLAAVEIISLATAGCVALFVLFGRFFPYSFYKVPGHVYLVGAVVIVALGGACCGLVGLIRPKGRVTVSAIGLAANVLFAWEAAAPIYGLSYIIPYFGL